MQNMHQTLLQCWRHQRAATHQHFTAIKTSPRSLFLAGEVSNISLTANLSIGSCTIMLHYFMRPKQHSECNSCFKENRSRKVLLFVFQWSRTQLFPPKCKIFANYLFLKQGINHNPYLINFSFSSAHKKYFFCLCLRL